MVFPKIGRVPSPDRKTNNDYYYYNYYYDGKIEIRYDDTEIGNG